MKNFIVFLVAIVFMLLTVLTVYAGQKEWATAGKILTGYVIADTFNKVISQPSTNRGHYSHGYYHGLPPQEVVEEHYYYYPTPAKKRVIYHYGAPHTVIERNVDYIEIID